MVSVCHYTSSFITLNETVKQRPFTVLTNGIHSQSNEKEKEKKRNSRAELSLQPTGKNVGQIQLYQNEKKKKIPRMIELQQHCRHWFTKSAAKLND